MQNRLPNLEAEDRRFDLHVGAEPIVDYNINLIYHGHIPHELMMPSAPLQSPEVVKDNLKKLGIFFK